jgi:hypothetical protein
MFRRVHYAIGISAFAVVAGAIYCLFYLPESVTYGQITLSSPEVFTRERLVNDRYQQDAWLRSQLDRPIDCNVGATVKVDQKVIAEVSANAQPKLAVTETQPPQNSQTILDGATQSNAKALDRDCFQQALDFREQIRSLLIENQLDDRHDLNGTSLFKLKFDVAVVPGSNTEALATIRVTVAGGDLGFDRMPISAQPGGAHRAAQAGQTASADRCTERAPDVDLAAWEPIYAEWIENIERRLNQTQKEQRQRYESDALGRSDYLDLIGYLSAQTKIADVRGLAGCDVASTAQLEKVAALPVETSEHKSWKLCLRSIATPKRPSAEYISKEQYVLQYADTSSAPTPLLNGDNNGSGRAEPSARNPEWAHDAEAVAQGNLDARLNEYFARRSVLLVLGIDEPLLGSANRSREPGSVFSRLLKLSFVNQSSDTPPAGYQVPTTSFAVLPRTYHIVGIDKTKLRETRYNEITQITTPIEGRAGARSGRSNDAWINYIPRVGFNEFGPRCGLPKTGTGTNLSLWDEDVRITQVGLGENAGEPKDYPIGPEDIESTSEPGVYLIRVRTGLYNFVSQLQNHGQPYTYSVAPQENGMMLHLEQHSSRQLDLSAQVGEEITAKNKVSSAARVGTEEMQDIASIIGFGEADKEGQATFGWVINPRDIHLDSKGRLVYKQSLRKYAVSALISVPSWWRSLSISTITSWRDSNGKDHQISEVSPVRIEIPSDYEAFEATLLGLQGPELDGSALDPIRLVAGNVPQKILIPGRRLWRSTEVTLGDQPADSIEVLPNMKGIIAKFKQISDSSTPDEQAYRCDKHKGRRDVEVKRTVRVWTSQGAVTLPQPATIYVLNRC